MVRIQVIGVVLVIAWLGSGGCIDADIPELQVSSEIGERSSGLDGPGVTPEKIDLDGGRFPAVVDVGGCTATVLGPHTQ